MAATLASQVLGIFVKTSLSQKINDSFLGHVLFIIREKVVTVLFLIMNILQVIRNLRSRIA